MIKGVIFDYDGLMVDTETLFLHEAVDLIRERNIDVDPETVKSMIGTDHRRAVLLNEKIPGFLDLMNSYMSNRTRTFPLLFPKQGNGDKKGLKELIDWLNQEKIPYVIASGSPCSDIQFMNARSLADIQPVAILSTREQPVLPKPDPGIFLLSAEKMKLRPEETLVLEDGKYGIMAAKAGGFPSVFIQDQVEPDEEMRESIQFEETDLLGVLEGLKEHRYDKK